MAPSFIDEKKTGVPGEKQLPVTSHISTIEIYSS
jgi:hypothetical protein